MNLATIKHVEFELPVGAVGDPVWNDASTVVIDKYWNGMNAPDGRHLETRLLWSDSALYARFEARQDEQLVVSENPVFDQKTLGLWDRDVCEIFIAPDSENPGRYFEFEVAPTGEWVDLTIEFNGETRKTDTAYHSGMTSFASVENSSVISAIRLPWQAFGRTPAAGDIWRGNIFRCVGTGPDRGYLAWQPTLTTVPNFHVPSKFGSFRFE